VCQSYWAELPKSELRKSSRITEGLWGGGDKTPGKPATRRRSDWQTSARFEVAATPPLGAPCRIATTRASFRARYGLAGGGARSCSGRCGCGTLPGPSAVELYLQTEAQQRANEHDDAQYASILHRRRDGDGANDVGCDEQLEPEQNDSTEPLAKYPIAIVAPLTAADRHRGCGGDAENDDRDSDAVNSFSDRIHRIREAHVRILAPPTDGAVV
jgi:hypothetical protein